MGPCMADLTEYQVLEVLEMLKDAAWHNCNGALT